MTLLPFHWPGLPGPGGEAREGGDLPPVEGAELGKLGEGGAGDSDCPGSMERRTGILAHPRAWRP